MIGAVLPASPEGASRAIAEPAGGRYAAAGSWLRARSRTTALLAVAALGSLAVGAAVSVRLIDGLAVLAALVLGIIAVARPALAGYLLVAVVPVTAGFQKGFPIRNLNLSEALVAFIGGLVILTAPATRGCGGRPWTGCCWRSVPDGSSSEWPTPSRCTSAWVFRRSTR